MIFFDSDSCLLFKISKNFWSPPFDLNLFNLIFFFAFIKIIASKYLEGLQNSKLVMPYVPKYADPSWHLFVVRTPQRDNFQKLLTKSGVETLIHYSIPPHKQQAYKNLAYPLESFPIASVLADEVISLPIGPHLEHNDVAKIISSVNRICENR